jgi:hypothetical protein
MQSGLKADGYQPNELVQSELAGLDTTLPPVITGIILSYLTINDKRYLTRDWKQIPAAYFLQNKDLRFLMFKQPVWPSENVQFRLADKGLFIWLTFIVRVMDYKWTNGPAICEAIARHGNINILRWARKHGCPWNSNTCSAAGRNGHLQVLKWVRTQGCPWNRNVGNYMAANGHLEVLQ